MKKIFVFLLCIIFSASIISASDYKIDISTAQEIFEAGEPIIFKVSLLDSDNKPVNDKVTVILEDAEKRVGIQETINSNEFVSLELSDKASYGKGSIIAQYKDLETKGFFEINIKELAKFEIENDELKITNIGNTQYTRTVQITIGETTGNKYPKLNVGEDISYKLVAPKGTYNIKISDGITTFTQGNVQLTGTGQVIGAIDRTPSKRSPVTGGIRPDKNSEEGFLSYMKNSKFTYVFIFVIFGATILLAIEKRFKKKVIS